VFDLQLETEVALADDWFLGFAAWHAAETGDGDFSETAAVADLRFERGPWTFGTSAGYHSYDHTFFRDAFDLGLFATWRFHEDLALTGGVWRDTGADAWYAKLEGVWSKPTGRDSFLEAVAGASWADDYYGRSGLNDAYARLSWTYAVSEQVSLTPFVGTSIPLDSGPEKNRLFGGLWFAVSF
jgi:outer membrane scaffolding protein for murein synthesis (MipA/OmpV family)